MWYWCCGKISETNNIEDWQVQELIKLNSILIIDLILLASSLHLPSDDKPKNLKNSSECHLVNLLFSLSAKQLANRVNRQTSYLSANHSTTKRHLVDIKKFNRTSTRFFSLVNCSFSDISFVDGKEEWKSSKVQWNWNFSSFSFLITIFFSFCFTSKRKLLLLFSSHVLRTFCFFSECEFFLLLTQFFKWIISSCFSSLKFFLTGTSFYITRNH